jgi:hypothetical protein
MKNQQKLEMNKHERTAANKETRRTAPMPLETAG